LSAAASHNKKLASHSSSYLLNDAASRLLIWGLFTRQDTLFTPAAGHSISQSAGSTWFIVAWLLLVKKSLKKWLTEFKIHDEFW
jgi:hypothetical protein